MKGSSGFHGLGGTRYQIAVPGGPTEPSCSAFVQKLPATRSRRDTIIAYIADVYEMVDGKSSREDEIRRSARDVEDDAGTEDIALLALLA